MPFPYDPNLFYYKKCPDAIHPAQTFCDVDCVITLSTQRYGVPRQITSDNKEEKDACALYVENLSSLAEG